MEDWDWELLNDSTPDQQHEQTVINQFDVDDDHNNNNNNNNSGVLHSDYFSVDSPPSPHHTLLEDEGDSSGDPTWIDPNNISVAGGLGGRTRISCSNSDSSEPTSDCSHNIEGENENENLISTSFNGGFSDAINSEKEEDFEGEERAEIDEGLHHLDDTGGGNASAVGAAEEERGREVSSGSNEKKKVVWWRVPLEVLRYCVLRVSPVWSLSMAAAAVMGFMILRRRYLYKMKRKAQGLQLKVTVDDKKVSQFTTRAALLNEAFSVVKRVPVIQPSFTGPGLAPWPVMSMR